MKINTCIDNGKAVMLWSWMNSKHLLWQWGDLETDLAGQAMSQLVMAVVHCHRHGVAHRDRASFSIRLWTSDFQGTRECQGASDCEHENIQWRQLFSGDNFMADFHYRHQLSCCLPTSSPGHQVGERDGCECDTICDQTYWLWSGAPTWRRGTPISSCLSTCPHAQKWKLTWKIFVLVWTLGWQRVLTHFVLGQNRKLNRTSVVRFNCQAILQGQGAEHMRSTVSLWAEGISIFVSCCFLISSTGLTRSSATGPCSLPTTTGSTVSSFM